MAKRREIRNSTAEFLIFQIEGKGQGVEVYYKDKTVWCTQKAMGVLFDCSIDNVSLHLKNIYKTKELKKSATAEKISVVRREGNRDINRTLQFYNLDAIISVGYRRWQGDGKGQTGRNSVPSEYLLSLPGTRPLSARYLSATCSV